MSLSIAITHLVRMEQELTDQGTAVVNAEGAVADARKQQRAAQTDLARAIRGLRIALDISVDDVVQQAFPNFDTGSYRLYARFEDGLAWDERVANWSSSYLRKCAELHTGKSS